METPSPAVNEAVPVRLSALRKRILRLSKGRGPFALADQILVSGCNFLSGIVLLRGLGLTQFGKYAIAYALLLYANNLQLSFVSAPMLSIAPLLREREQEEFLDGMYSVQAISSLLLFLVFLFVGLTARLFTDFYDVRSIVAFTFCVGTYQLQDWLRRYYFLRNRGGWAIATDAISYLGQILVLLVLWRFHFLTLSTTFATIAVTSFLGFLIGPVTEHMRLSRRHLGTAWSRCKTLSRDLLIVNQVRWLGIQGVLLIGTGIVGAEGIGGLRATQNMTGPVNLALLSIENVIPVRLAEEIYRHGADAAYRFTRKATIGGVLLFSIVLIPLILFGKPILRFLYGAEVVAYYVPMLIQMVNMVLATVVRMYFYFFRSVQETKAMLVANGLCAIVSVATIFPLGHFFHASGIILASTSGQIAIILVSVWYWRAHKDRILRDNPALIHQKSTR
jgi:O-antigen/teichoic acid export membrane protein